MDDLQRIVDGLATLTGRPVSVHDRRGRLLAYSAHDDGSLDDVRLQSILTRRGPTPSFQWSLSLGIDRAEGPMRLPANPGLGMRARICAPVRLEQRLLGWVWLMDPDESLGDEGMRHVAVAAESAAQAMHHETLRSEVQRARERELLRDLLGEDEQTRADAVDLLIEGRLLTPSEVVVALVVRPLLGRAPLQRGQGDIRDQLDAAVGRVRDTLPARQAIPYTRTDHAVLLLTTRARALGDDGVVQHAATALRRSAEDALGGLGWTVRVGVGDPQPQLGAAHVSYRHARQAAVVAGLDRSLPAVAEWRSLGAYQVLVDLPVERIARESLHPGILRLLESREAPIWLRTLEVYLDLAGDARSAASKLSIQRGSLYHRLHRIEEVAGVDLGTGSDRLALHLGLKIARLAGLLEGG